jgi:hypothetical protein
MTTPFKQYVDIKDNYCLSYFGEDESMLDKIFKAKEYIEKELPDLKVFVICKDLFKNKTNNVIFESKMGEYKGKMACVRNLEKKEDVKSFLIESKIPIPEDF